MRNFVLECYSKAHLTTGTGILSEVPPAWTICIRFLGVFLGKEYMFKFKLCYLSIICYL